MPRRAVAAALLIAAVACSAARTVPVGEPSRSAGGDPASEIIAALQASADEWNRGSLDGFLLPYLDAPTTTYVGPTELVRGKAAIRESYATTWFRTGQPAGRLGYRQIEVRMLGPDHALVVGRWNVARADGREQNGMFSLTFQRTREGWKIIHDHSS